MKRMLVLVLVFYFSALSDAVLAQISPDGDRPGEFGSEKALSPGQFQEKKARLLSMIDKHRTRLEQAKACIEAATSNEELRKCRPEQPMGPRGMHRGGPDQQKPLLPPEE